MIVLAAVAPIFSQLLAMAVSRQREYLADASSVEFTRNPRALLRALEHIAETESPLKQRPAGTAHLFIVNPREGVRENGEGFFANLFRLIRRSAGASHVCRHCWVRRARLRASRLLKK